MPIILLGHSMGSYLAQGYLLHHSASLHGAILSGSNFQPVALYGAARQIARVEKLRQGGKGRSALIEWLSFGSFNNKFKPVRTPFDWLSRDPAEVDKYASDPMCGFRCTNQLWIDLLGGLQQISKASNLAQIAPGLPLLVIGGECDPVSDGKRLKDLADALRSAGSQNLQLKIYPQARHELFNETNRTNASPSAGLIDPTEPPRPSAAESFFCGLIHHTVIETDDPGTTSIRALEVARRTTARRSKSVTSVSPRCQATYTVTWTANRRPTGKERIAHACHGHLSVRRWHENCPDWALFIGTDELSKREDWRHLTGVGDSRELGSLRPCHRVFNQRDELVRMAKAEILAPRSSRRDGRRCGDSWAGWLVSGNFPQDKKRQYLAFFPSYERTNVRAPVRRAFTVGYVYAGMASQTTNTDQVCC